MKFERRDDERWHLATINCGNSETVHETVHVDPDDGFTRINGTVRLSLPFVDDPTWCDTCQAIVAERYRSRNAHLPLQSRDDVTRCRVERLRWSYRPLCLM